MNLKICDLNHVKNGNTQLFLLDQLATISCNILNIQKQIMNHNFKVLILVKLLFVLWLLPAFAENSPTSKQQYVENMLMGSSKDDESMVMENKAILESLPKISNIQNEFARKLNLDALAMIKIHNFEKALTLLAQAYELAPSDAEISNNYGFVLMKLRDLDRAYSVLVHVLTIKPDRTSAWRNLADVIALKGQVDLAEAGYLNVYRFSKNIQKTRKMLQNSQLTEDSSYVKEALNKALTKAKTLFFPLMLPDKAALAPEAYDAKNKDQWYSKRSAFMEKARQELEGEYINGVKNETLGILNEPEVFSFIAKQLEIDDKNSERKHYPGNVTEDDVETEMMNSVCPCTVAEALALRIMRRERGFTDAVNKSQQLLIDQPPGLDDSGFKNLSKFVADYTREIEGIIKVKEAFKATHPKISLTQYGEIIPYQGVPNQKFSDAVLSREIKRPVHKVQPYYDKRQEMKSAPLVTYW